MQTYRSENPSIENVRVLLIEHETDLVEMLMDFLEMQGAVALSAPTGTDGLRATREEEPDVVLLDMGLPDVGGCAVLSQIRGHPPTHDIPVIVVTGQRSPDVVRKCLDLGCSGFFTKPARLHDLCGAIARAVAKGNQS